MINDAEFLAIRALHRQGLTYAEIGRLVGRDWRGVKRYLVEGAEPVYPRRRAASMLDPLKPVIHQGLAREPRLWDPHPPRTSCATTASRVLPDGASLRGALAAEAASRVQAPVRDRARAPAQVDWSHEQPITTSTGLELPLYCFTSHAPLEQAARACLEC